MDRALHPDRRRRRHPDLADHHRHALCAAARRRLLTSAGRAPGQEQGNGFRNRRFFVLGVPAATVATVLLLAEAVLRFLPVSGSLRVQSVTAADPILHFEPDRDLVWSRGWDFARVNRLHVNRAGYVNERDYDPDSVLPAVAVIGDSYVEAAMVPPAETLQGRLARRLDGRVQVMSFGASGAALSQYLVWADHARRTYRPAAMIFVIVGNDFDESLLTYKQAPGFHYFAEAKGGLVLTRVDYDPGFWRPLLRRSALVRYLVLNVGIGKLGGGGAEPDTYVGNKPARLPETVVRDAEGAVTAFLDRVGEAAGLAPGRILFVLDALRPALYDRRELGRAHESYFGRLRRTFAAEARARAFGLVDMQPHFAQAFSREGRRFDYPDDGHWNGYAHGIVAGAAAAALPVGVSRDKQ